MIDKKMELASIHKIFVITIDSLSLLLGVWIFFSDPKSKVNRMFSLMAVFLFLWITFGYLASVAFAGNDYLALIFAKINTAAVCLFFIPFYFFSMHFPVEGRKHPWLDKFVLIFWPVLALFSLFTDLVVPYMKNGEVHYGDVLGNVFLFSTLLAALFSIFLLFKKSMKLREQEKAKAQYLLTGMLIWFFLNVIFNVFGQPIFKTTKYYAFGDYSAIFVLSLTAYAMIKKGLFGVKVILTEILVAVMGIILFALPFFVNIAWLKALLFAIFVIFCVVGYFLIRYAVREEKGKKILEEKVKERTAELEKSKDIAEERAKEIEKWYRLTVGREIRMAELKDEMKKKDEAIKKSKSEDKASPRG